MGMYTELVIKAKITEYLPDDVWMILDYLFNPKTEVEIYDEHMQLKSDVKLPDHPFFDSSRWEMIGSCNSYYHIPESQSFFADGYLFSRSDLKNYGGEIENFINWITPYLDEPDGKFIGWKWYEEYHEPTFIYKNGECDE